MSILISPIVYLLDKINFKKRFILLSVLIFSAFFGVSWLYLHSKVAERANLISEREPMQYYEPIIEMMQKLSASRLDHLMAAKKTEDENLLRKTAESDGGVDAALNRLKNIQHPNWNVERCNELIKSIDSEWHNLKISLSKGYTEDLYQRNQDISDKLSDLMSTVVDESYLSLDADPISYNLIDIFMKNGPVAAEQTDNLRGLGMLAYFQKQATPELREKINYYLALAEITDKNLAAGLYRLFNLDSKYRVAFGQQVDMVEKDYVANTIKRDILKPINLAATLNEFSDEVSNYSKNYINISELSYRLFNERYAARIKSLDYDIVLTFVVLGLVFVVICLIFIAFFRSTDSVVKALVANANAIAEGDLSQVLDTNRLDEFGMLTRALSNMQTKVALIVQQIKNSSNTVGRGAKEISQGNLDLSKRTEEQASSLASTAASMEELSVTVKENAKQSKKAAELAEHAREQADVSGTVVNDAVEAMSQINASSKKISEISGVIDEIAFQTNLLALNAAIEAARAGDQGRGFAVVAQEVRNLAQRSSTSAKEINVLINDSVEKISKGTDLVSKSGGALHEIVKSASSVSELVGSMATATAQQSKGLEEINKAITQMDSITQQNAALVEETAAASENVNQQVRDLIKQIDFFKDSKTSDPIIVSENMDIQAGAYNAHRVPEDTPVFNKNSVDLKTYIPKASRKNTPESDWSEF